MIVLISGSNRHDNKTRHVARLLETQLQQAGQDVFFIDLEELPADLFSPAAYARKPASFAPLQEAILRADGILTVVPEYNGSFPGALKLFIDMLQFPESLADKPAAFVGLAAGRWGGLRAVEHLEMVFQYRHAHLYGRRVFLPCIGDILGEEGTITDADITRRLGELVNGFVDFCPRVPQ